MAIWSGEYQKEGPKASFDWKSNSTGIAADFVSHFDKLLEAIDLTIHPKPPVAAVEDGIRRFLPLVRHKADIAILVGAISADPDWLVTCNLERFNSAFARLSGLRIVSPSQLMGYLSVRQIRSEQ